MRVEAPDNARFVFSFSLKNLLSRIVALKVAQLLTHMVLATFTAAGQELDI